MQAVIDQIKTRLIEQGISDDHIDDVAMAAYEYFIIKHCTIENAVSWIMKWVNIAGFGSVSA